MGSVGRRRGRNPRYFSIGTKRVKKETLVEKEKTRTRVLGKTFLETEKQRTISPVHAKQRIENSTSGSARVSTLPSSADVGIAKKRKESRDFN